MFQNTFNILSYEVQNILIYCFVLPLMWSMALDYKIVRKTAPFGFTFLYLCVAVLLYKAHNHMFYYNRLVAFLESMSKYGYNYTKASILFCIIYPMVITIGIMLLPTRKYYENKSI